jgi:hypothetical protein
VAPTGRTQLSANGIVNDTGEPDRVAVEARQHAVEDLPNEALVLLLGSRYCEADRLSDIAWSLSGITALGWGRVTKFLLPTEPCLLNGGFQYAYGLIINPHRHREGMLVLRSVGK